MKANRIKTISVVTFSGLALTLALIASYAASEQETPDRFEQEKLKYIRLYAWPKKVSAGTNEVLFAVRQTGKSDSALSPAPGAPPNTEKEPGGSAIGTPANRPAPPPTSVPSEGE